MPARKSGTLRRAWQGDSVRRHEVETSRLGPSKELLKLVELAIGRVVKVILQADDSAGTIGDLARQLLETHEQVCDAGVADPKALAKWMVRFGFDDQDFFTVDPVRYSTALAKMDSIFCAARSMIDRRLPILISLCGTCRSGWPCSTATSIAS